MRLKRFLSTMLAAAMLFNTVSEPLIATASNTEESKFHEIVDTGTFDECTDALLEDFLSYGKVPEEKRKAYLESLTSEERYEFQMYAKYAYIKELQKLDQKANEKEVKKAANAIHLYIEIVENAGNPNKKSDEQVLKNIGKRYNRTFSDYESLNDFLNQQFTINFKDLLVEMESVPSTDKVILSANVIKFKEYIHSVYGFSDRKTYNSNRVQLLNNFYGTMKEMSEKERTVFFDSLTEEQLYEISLVAKYYLLLQIIERSTIEDLNEARLVTLIENVKPAIEVAMKAKDANPKNKAEIRKSTCRHISLHQNYETDSFNEFHKSLQKETDLKVTSVLKELDTFQNAKTVSSKLLDFQNYLYDLFGIVIKKGVERETTGIFNLHTVESGKPNTYIPAKYSFNPQWSTNGKRVVNFSHNSSYAWRNNGGSILGLKTSDGFWYKPTSSTNGKFSVTYKNVGTFNDQKVDMKVTYSAFNGDCKGIGYGESEIAQGYANFSSDYNESRYMDITFEFFKAGTQTHVENICGYMTLNDLDYFKYKDEKTNKTISFSESLEPINGVTKELYVNPDNKTKISITGSVISAGTGVGGEKPTDGANIVYCFFRPSHTIRWRGALNNYSKYQQNIRPNEVKHEDRIRHWLNGFKTGGTNASKENFLFDETFFEAGAGEKFTMDKSRKSSKMPNGFQFFYFRKYNKSTDRFVDEQLSKSYSQENNKMYFEYRDSTFILPYCLQDNTGRRIVMNAMRKKESKKAPKEFIGAAKFRMEKMERIPECVELQKGCGRHRFLFAYYNQCILIKSSCEARRMTLELNNKFAEPLSTFEIDQMIRRVNQHVEEPGLDIHVNGMYLFSTEKLVEYLPISLEEARKMGFLRSLEKRRSCQAHQKEAAERDKEVAKLWLEGFSAREISKKLEGKFNSVGVAERTVRNIVKRLGMKENRNMRIEDIDFTLCARYHRKKQSDVDLKSATFPLNKKGIHRDVDDTKVRERLLCDLTLRRDCNILGAPGTGKSTFIKMLCQKTQFTIKMTAYTGAAAERISGQTIHACLGIPVLENYDIASVDMCTKLSEMKAWDILVIDEIGMVPKDLFQFIRAILIYVEETYAHHIQLVTLGDFHQLAPINGEFAFGTSDAHWNNAYVLTTIYRQSQDLAFAEALHQISVGDVSGIQYVNAHAKCGIGYVEMIEALEGGAIYLGSYRKDVNRINQIMTMRHRNDDSYKEFHAIGKEDILPAYVGMPILMTKNSKKFKKGTRGIITKIANDYVVMKTYDNTSHRIRRVELEDEEGVTYEQFPFKPCYAMTIHKIQGATIDGAVILNPRCFESGQLYTALSRVRSLKQILLTDLIKEKDVKVSKEVLEYMKNVS